MRRLLESLCDAYPELTFTPGDTFYWSPETCEVFYNPRADTEKARWSLLHETGHALLGHTSYQRDIELLKLEMAAWDKARQLAREQGVAAIDEEHIQDCLDTYRDWLNARSVCPGCTTKSFQQRNPRHYRCHNCHTTWQVTPARFARPYRSVKTTSQTSIIFA